jgi:two-component system, LytTR family, sensor kinase
MNYKYLYHSVLWLAYIATILTFSTPLGGSIWVILLHTFFVAVLVYTNFFWLIPSFFKKEKFFSYFFYLIGISLVATPLELICLYAALANHPEARIGLIENQFSHFLVLFFLTATSTVFKVVKFWLLQQRVQIRLENEHLQSELNFLKAQINPHFLFNTLNNIYALSLKKSESAPALVLQLAEMMRYMLYECNEKWVSLEKEVEYVRHYLGLEQARYGEKAQIEFDYVSDRNDYKIAPLLFVTFLENSFKHGLSQQIGSGSVIGYLQIEDFQLSFQLENTLPPPKSNPTPEPRPLNGAEPRKSGGIGLKNIKRRLELLYPKAFQLSIEQTETAYMVYLSLDLSLANK